MIFLETEDICRKYPLTHTHFGPPPPSVDPLNRAPLRLFGLGDRIPAARLHKFSSTPKQGRYTHTHTHEMYFLSIFYCLFKELWTESLTTMMESFQSYSVMYEPAAHDVILIWIIRSFEPSVFSLSVKHMCVCCRQPVTSETQTGARFVFWIKYQVFGLNKIFNL